MLYESDNDENRLIEATKAPPTLDLRWKNCNTHTHIDTNTYLYSEMVLNCNAQKSLTK